MARGKATFVDKDHGWDRVKREIAKARKKPHVAVGIQGTKAAEDHGGIPNIKVAVAHELGADIDHPGGTAYFIREDGSAQFVSNEAAKGRDLPRTQPHKIKIPRRSFIRDTIDIKQKAIMRQAKELQQGVLLGNMDTKKALERLGLFIKGEIRKRISKGIPPPLKAATIRRKKSAKPLIDTGQLSGSVDHKTRNV